jgi:hypothetical protein
MASMADATKWLMLEAFVPLGGASVLFLCQVLPRYLADRNKGSFRFAWTDALDPLGWLYGGVILALQSGLRVGSDRFGTMNIGCYVGAFACGMCLLAAMEARRADPGWRPTRSIHIVSVLLVAIIVGVGYRMRIG